ncbi:olfactory receptor 10K1-like [Rhinatrema bivittatum]|uniref:olfactory receptor 10K1-like n=1 Tax=Rhinatrema bivittatum TaxID=194408 RepID=UPI00112BA043|nr:olfactory receptor 10K1-like [Rhinatrema bivittatum]
MWMGKNQTSVTEFVFLTFANIPEYHVLLFVVFLLVYLILLAENISLMIVIKVDACLHTPMYFFLFNLTLLETCYTLVIIPQMLVHLLSKKKTISFAGCATQMFFFVGLGNAEIFLVLAMAYDRLVAVCNPLRYNTIMSKKRCITLMCAVLVAGLLLSVEETVLVFHLPFCGSNEINHFFCDVGQVVILTSACIDFFFLYEIVFLVSALLLFTIPFVLVLISYMYIISAILKIKSADGRHKAFSSCSSHLTLVILQYSCLSFMYLRPKSTFYLDKDRLFVVIYTMGTPILIPIIYSLRNKIVKDAFKKIIAKKLFLPL